MYKIKDADKLGNINIAVYENKGHCLEAVEIEEILLTGFDSSQLITSIENNFETKECCEKYLTLAGFSKDKNKPKTIVYCVLSKDEFKQYLMPILQAKAIALDVLKLWESIDFEIVVINFEIK